MRFYVREQLGPKREITQQGFLLCRDVPIARTGDQIYGPGESPIEVGPDGRAVVSREADEVFRPETIASFNGSTFTAFHYEGELNHPKDANGEGVDVTPETWKEFAAGYCFNVRRGTGPDADLLLADIMVTSDEAIKLITLDGKDELSCGYDSDYIQTGPGRGKQIDILGNHVALVEAGRCGWRCSVQDSKQSLLGGKMAIKAKKNQGIVSKFRDAMHKAFASKDEAEFSKALDAMEEEEVAGDKTRDKDGDEEEYQSGATHIHMESPTSEVFESRLAALEAKHGDLESRVTDCESRLDKTEDADEDDEEKDGTADAKAKDAKAKDEAVKCFECGERFPEGTERYPNHQKADGKKCPMSDKKVPEMTNDAEKEDEDEYEEEAPEGEEKKARKAEDSAYMGDSFQTTLSNAEVLAPGISFPTFDAAAKPKSTLDAMTSFRKKALAIATSTPVGATVVAECRQGRALTADKLANMSVRETRQLFTGAAASMKAYNAAQGTRTADYKETTHTGAIRTAAQANKVYADYWANKG